MVKVLLEFIKKDLEFIIPELISVCSVYNIPIPREIDTRNLLRVLPNDLLLVADFDNVSDVALLLSRCVLIREASVLIREADSLDLVKQEISNMSEDEWSPILSAPRSSFCIRVRSVHKRLGSGKRGLEKELASFLFPMKSFPNITKVDLSSPDASLIFYVKVETQKEANQGPQKQTHAYFGFRPFSKASRASKLPGLFDLRKRPFIGTTSMLADISFLTANMALVVPGSVVYDPFCGTASILISCARLGAFVVGSDINRKVLNDPGLLKNFSHYGIEDRLLGFFSSDFYNSPVAKRLQVDAIVTDPPYGIRESSQRKVDNGKRERRIPFDTVLDDLFETALRMLRVGGRLCFWMPVGNDPEESSILPVWPEGLKLVSVSQDPVLFSWRRNLLVFERI